MKKNLVLVLFFTVNLSFIFLHLFKQNYGIQLSYEQQKLEKIRDQLLEQQIVLQEELAQLKNPAKIKDFAHNQLHMQKINLKNIQRLPDE